MISERAQEADPEGEGLTVQASTIELDADEGISEEDTARALVCSINKFTEQPATLPSAR